MFFLSNALVLLVTVPKSLGVHSQRYDNVQWRNLIGLEICWIQPSDWFTLYLLLFRLNTGVTNSLFYFAVLQPYSGVFICPNTLMSTDTITTDILNSFKTCCEDIHELFRVKVRNMFIVLSFCPSNKYPYKRFLQIPRFAEILKFLIFQY